MSVFVDTSALYAALDADDDAHARALDGWNELITAKTPLTTSNYVCVESAALLRRGLESTSVELGGLRQLRGDAVTQYRVGIRLQSALRGTGLPARVA